MLRRVTAPSLGLAMGTLLACTAANPAYRLEDLPRSEENGPPAAISDAAPRPADAGPPGPDAGRPDGGADAQGTAACGVERPDLRDLVGVDSLAIDRAGNIYFSHDDGMTAWIGKLPPRGGADLQWLTIATGLPTRGMAIDSDARALYYTAGAPVAELQAVELDATPPRPRTIYRGLKDPNDVVVGPDGKIYLTEQGDGHVYSLTATGAKTKVTRTTIGVLAESSGPAALAFAPDGKLVVGIKGTVPLLRLTLGPDGTEVERRSFGAIDEWVNGLAYDQRGRLYVSLYDQAVPKRVVRLDSDTAAPVTVLSGGRFSGLAFGRGQLDCHDLYIAEPAIGAVLRRLTVDTPGLPVP